MRRAAKVDTNSDEITAALVNIGADVRDTHVVAGFVDKVVGYHGQTFLVEIMRTHATPYVIRLHEQRRAGWKGGPWAIVSTVTQALAAIGATGETK